MLPSLITETVAKVTDNLLPAAKLKNKTNT